MPQYRARVEAKRLSVNRRSFRGRRLALAVGLAGAVAMCSGGVAWGADPVVVNATVYSGSSGSPTNVTLSTLNGCPLYSGSSQMQDPPATNPYTPPANSTWSLADVLKCALSINLNTVTSVQVYQPPPGPQGWESLSSSDLTNSQSNFSDTNALPVISNDQGANQSTYFRPWRGGSDNNYVDKIVNSGPVQIAVYQNGSELNVTLAQQVQSTTATTDTVQFSVVAHAPNGSLIPSSSLTYSWDLGNGQTSTAATPTGSYQPGTYPVSVQVTEQGTKQYGAGTTDLSFNPPGGGGGSGGSGGGGGSGTGGSGSGGGQSPSGPTKSSGTKAGTAPGKTSNGSKTGKHHHATSKTTGKQHHNKSKVAAKHHSSTKTTPATTPTPASATSGSAAHASAPVKGPSRSVANGSKHAQVVSGRVIGNVTPVAPNVSPLVHLIPASVATAPALRAGGSTSILPGLGAGFAVLLLLVLGAGRELRWRGLALPRFGG